MRTSLGISAGNEVVCSALVATAANGAQTFDYRVVSADPAHSDLGDLVASSIELMTNQLPTTQAPRDMVHPVGARFAGAHQFNLDAMHSKPPTSVAVAYRGKEQEQAIRSATKHRDLRLISESTAALTYLRDTGLLDRYATVALVDLGATGLSVTVADQADGTVLRCDRTSAISGNAIDELIYHHLVDLHYARRGTRPNRGMLTNRGRAAKEHLSVAPAVTIDHVAGQPLKLTRADFDELIADLLREAAVYATTTFTRASRSPEAVAVIGGGANIPAVVSTLADQLDIPVFTVPDPESVIAKGAALVADSAQPAGFPVATLAADAPAGTFTKVVGTLAGAIVVVGLIIGYGVKTLAPTADDEVNPAGTTSSTQLTTPPTSTVPSTGSGTTSSEAGESTRPSGTTPPSTTRDSSQPSTPAATTAPSLRPAPDLPRIPFPEIPELFGPLLGGTQAPPPPPRNGSHEQGRSGTQSTEPTTTEPAPAPTTRVPSVPRSNSGSAGSDQPNTTGQPSSTGQPNSGAQPNSGQSSGAPLVYAH